MAEVNVEKVRDEGRENEVIMIEKKEGTTVEKKSVEN